MQKIEYWKISPWDWGKDPVGWEKQWYICLKEKKIAMGWDAVGDLSKLGLEQIKKRLYEKEGYSIPTYKTRLPRDARQLFDFKNIKVGDIVVANKGQKEIAGIGRVVGEYYYNPKPVHFRHTLPVKWLDTERRKIKRQMDWLQTVIPLTEQKAQKLGVINISESIQKIETEIKKGAKFSEQLVKTRTFQQVFRNIILENYGGMCAVCDVDDDSLLRGCHIVPVKDAPDIATNLSNGICLCVLHDAAFENGIFSISDKYEIIVADSFKTTSSVLNSMIFKLKGKKIRLPDKQPPNKSYLKRHRESHGF